MKFITYGLIIDLEPSKASDDSMHILIDLNWFKKMKNSKNILVYLGLFKKVRNDRVNFTRFSSRKV